MADTERGKVSMNNDHESSSYTTFPEPTPLLDLEVEEIAPMSSNPSTETGDC